MDYTVHGIAKSQTWLSGFCFHYFNFLEKAVAPHSSTLAWKIPWTEEPGRLQSMASLRVRHDGVTSLSLFTFMYRRRKFGNPLQCSCLENFRGPSELGWGQANTESGEGVKSLKPGFRKSCVDKTMFLSISSNSPTYKRVLFRECIPLQSSLFVKSNRVT